MSRPEERRCWHVVGADPAQVAEQAVPRIVSTAALEAQVGPVLGLPTVAPGLVCALVVPEGGGWALVSPSWLVAEAGPEVWVAAQQRLSADLRVAEINPADVDDPWGTITGISSTSPHAASWLLVADQLVQRLVPGHDLAEGAIVAAPSAHRLVVMPCVAPAAALRGPLMRAPHVVLDHWHEAVEPVSPHLYHWQGGGLQQLTRFRGDRCELVLPGGLKEWLAEQG